MSKWESLETAPKDGTWIKVRGRDFGHANGRRHYAIAFYEDDNWNEVGSAGGLLYYLDSWQPLSNGT